MSKINVDKKLVEHMSDLARIKIHDNEVQEYQENFQKILNYITMLDEVNTSEVKPLYNPITELTHFYEEKLENSFKQRVDETEESLEASKVLQNASSVKNNEFKINSVIEE